MLQGLRQHRWWTNHLSNRAVWLRGLATSHSITVNVGNRPVTLSVGRLAHLADGSVLIESGQTAVLVTGVSHQLLSSSPSSGVPLKVQYRERSDAARRIPHNFLRRDLRATEKEVLTSRAIDRSLRPLFPKGYLYDTQIMCNLLSLGTEEDPEVMSMNGAAAALSMSSIPWGGPLGTARVCMVGDRLVANPPRGVLQDPNLNLNLLVACQQDGIVMVEGSGKEVSEDVVCEAVALAGKTVEPFLEALSEFQIKHGKQKREFKAFLASEEMYSIIKRECRERVMHSLQNTSHSKTTRDNELFQIRDEMIEKLTGEDPGLAASDCLAHNTFWEVSRECMAELVLDHQMRCDGRGFDDLRAIDCSVDTFPALHGSSLFTRGETQVLCSVTFDSLESAAKSDVITKLLGGQISRKFMVHYEFPPFATNSISLARFPDRREVGHGALAQSALQPVIPGDFPFTIRLTSQVLASNGSSSIATVCGGSLALRDAGVPISRPVGGVACGLVTKCGSGDGRQEIMEYRVLTDLLGIEDALGNMDFKVAGTRNGITFMQCDIKGLNGLPMSIYEESLRKAKSDDITVVVQPSCGLIVREWDGRMKVLDIMEETQPSPRSEMKENCPAYETIEVPLPKRNRIIGAGGHRIKALAAETGAEVQSIGDHHMSIFAPTQTLMDIVKTKVENLLMNDEQDVELEFGKTYTGKIVEIRNYGAILELDVPGAVVAPSVLLHVSQMDHKPVRHPSAIGLAEGDYVDIRYFGRDPTTGRARVSRKSLLPLPDQASSSPRHHSSLANEKEDVRQRPFPSRSMHLHKGRASEHHPALERAVSRYTRHRRPTERVWSQREEGQPRVHQERSGYSPRWTSKY